MNREALMKRINALRSRTVAAGCTEAEAMAAAEKVAQLMAEYEVDAEQLGMGQEAVRVKTSPRSPVSQLWGTVATCTNTASIFTREQRTRHVVFVGREPWPSIAAYLCEVCENAVQNELKKFRKSEFYRRRRSPTTKRDAAEDFIRGMVARLRPKLRELFNGREDLQASQAAAEELDIRFPSAKTIKRPTRKVRFDQALSDGWLAGANVNLSHGVNGRPEQTRLLTGGIHGTR